MLVDLAAEKDPPQTFMAQYNLWEVQESALNVNEETKWKHAE